VVRPAQIAGRLPRAAREAARLPLVRHCGTLGAAMVPQAQGRRRRHQGLARRLARRRPLLPLPGARAAGCTHISMLHISTHHMRNITMDAAPCEA